MAIEISKWLHNKKPGFYDMNDFLTVKVVCSLLIKAFLINLAKSLSSFKQKPTNLYRLST